MSIIIDLNLVCVICLQDGELMSVFDRDDDTEMKIVEKIMKCSDLSIGEDTKLPDKICNKCVLELATTYRFLQKCEAAMAVFRTIQQQEDDLATYELEQQKIKIPSGLKIKRIKPESTTYLMPMQLELMSKQGPVCRERDEALVSSLEVEEELEPMSAEEEEEKEEEETDEEEKEEEEKDEDEVEKEEEEEEEQQLEEVDLDDYYEAEEILDDNSEENTVEIKVEKQVAAVKQIRNPSTQKALENTSLVTLKKVIKKEDVKVEGDSDDFVAEENMPPMPEYVPKRGRGRPKKLKSSPVKRPISSRSRVSTTIDTGNEKTEQANENETMSSSVTKSTVLKPIAVVQKTHKSNSLPPDTKPTKICEICGNSYKYQHALNAHMRRHNNDRPFNCEFCDKAFVSAVELRRHMRVHTGHKPYACQYCDRRFSDFGSRIKHERTHTGERPYNCTTCGKAFAYAHVLSVHIRTHTGEKKFRCSICGKGFTKKAYLETHTEQHMRIVAMGGPDEYDQTSEDCDRSELQAIKDVALEECIFTTEYIEDDEDETASVTPSAIHMSEEHLEANEHDMDDDYDEAIADNYPRITLLKRVKSDDDSNSEEET